MADQLQLRGGTTAQTATFTGALREVTVDTDKDTLVVHDNATVGGKPLLREDLSNLPAGTIDNADINASAAIVDTKLATIATAGKVSNSATTATNANTASAIVARDASGNFTAGTITAALTGAASSNVLKAGDTMTGALVVPLASAATPSLTFTGDTNTGIYSPGADQVAVATNGVERVEFGTGEVVFNDGGANYDFRIEGDTNANLFFVDASAEAVGIGTTSPSTSIDVRTISTTAYSASNLSAYTGAYISNDGTGGFANITLNAADATGNANCITAISAISESSGTRNSALAFATRTHSTGNIVERARIDSSGRLLVGTSTATANGGVLELSSGITFPATAVAASNANTLDDYEEGTFTCTVNVAGGSVTVDASVNQGRYTKIGNIVHVQGRMQLTAISSPTGNWSIDLPFTVAPHNTNGSNEGNGAALSANIDFGTNTMIVAVPDRNSANCFFYSCGDNSAMTQLNGDKLSATSSVSFQVTYIAA